MTDKIIIPLEIVKENCIIRIGTLSSTDDRIPFTVTITTRPIYISNVSLYAAKNSEESLIKQLITQLSMRLILIGKTKIEQGDLE